VVERAAVDYDLPITVRLQRERMRCDAAEEEGQPRVQLAFAATVGRTHAHPRALLRDEGGARQILATRRLHLRYHVLVRRRRQAAEQLILAIDEAHRHARAAATQELRELEGVLHTARAAAH